MTQKIAALAAWVAEAFHVGLDHADAAIGLLESGKRIPFIARYRKELTGGLDASQLRLINERVLQRHELGVRRHEIMTIIQDQGRLTQPLQQQLLHAESKASLEDLFAPYRERRGVSKASVAEAAGLLPLAMALLHDPACAPEVLAQAYVASQHGIADVASALQGAREILIQQCCANVQLLQEVRSYGWQHAVLESRALQIKKPEYADYVNYTQLLHQISPRDALMLFRGRREQVLRLNVLLPLHACDGEAMVARAMHVDDQGRLGDRWLIETVRLAWKTKLYPMLTSELLARLRAIADEEAIQGYSRELHHALMKAPAGPVVTMGLYLTPRSGVKVAVLDAWGQCLDDTTVFMWGASDEREQALITLAKLASKHAVRLISVGQGNLGSRDMSRVVMNVIKRYPDMALTYVLVNDVGAMAYAESVQALHDYPELTPGACAAVSITRRLQDPLLALAVIDPKALVIGSSLHDVNQLLLARRLSDVIEQCVNELGVDVNTASASLLRYVCGLNEAAAKKIVMHRDMHGAFESTAQVQQLLSMDDDSFEQVAVFLRVSPVVDKRPLLRLPRLNKTLTGMHDLRKGMVLDAMVSAMNHVGVFVDVGLSHHGLIHASMLSAQHAHVLSIGDVVKVRVVHVDLARQRFNLSIKNDTPARPKPDRAHVVSASKPLFNTAMADALLKLKRISHDN